MKLTIGYFYREQLNLYGDTGNIEILLHRARKRGIEVDLVDIGISTTLSSALMKSLNLVFMGGGPDAGQREMYEDLYKNKGSYLKEFIEDGGTGLFICGSYQLLGKYYKSDNGTILEGLNVFDLYTEHFGKHKPRIIGNLVCEISDTIKTQKTFQAVNHTGSTLVGFENHGGRTYLGKTAEPFAKVVKGKGNNGEDSTEGVIYKNSIGSYSHGPVLSKNPHLADYLIARSLGLESLQELDDSLILAAHTASKKLKSD